MDESTVVTIVLDELQKNGVANQSLGRALARAFWRVNSGKLTEIGQAAAETMVREATAASAQIHKKKTLSGE